ncbi:MAG: pyrimidine/purine nucleoside phosphorylase [Anaerolineales bacterium]|nr:pyrimidine/purine nucleoside phosphorylase [Anaerolineales bacterium]
MSHPVTTTGDQPTNALHALGVNFIMGAGSKDESLHEQPARLIAALAESKEARLRLSLIPLFLEHPEFAAHVRAAARSLNPSARLTLHCYYSAAVWKEISAHGTLHTLRKGIKLLGCKFQLVYFPPASDQWQTFREGQSFSVPANSAFKLKLKGPVDYCCSYG